MTPPENKPLKTLWERIKTYSIANAIPLSLILGIVGVVIGLLGSAFAVWSYYASRRYPLLTYSVFPIHGRIVRTENLGDLKVLYKGTEVQGDISIVYVVFQNFGSAPVEKADILTPIWIKLEGNPRILEAIIQKNEKTRPVTDASPDLSQANSGQVGVAWRILEQNDGFVVQITYVGSLNTGLQVTGDVKGQQQGLQKRESPPGIWTTTKEYNLSQYLSLALILLSFCALFSLVVAVILHRFPISLKLKEDLGPEKLRLIRNETRFYPIVLMAASSLFLGIGSWLWVVAR